ncbi:MAG TPA: pilus assembly protein N-terminal domain-containing protein [Thermoanaerobaculia bacterium]|jgi:Flp pilus assembly secretin CpaC|nr:pilus assembly protein N-terminal domain-containing protein [Thermoanaerobaculia bacterium]
MKIAARVLVTLGLLFPGLGSLGAVALGQGAPDLQPVESRGTLRGSIGIGRLVTLPLDLERLALADEGLARLQVVSGREVLLTGLRTGKSTLFVWLAGGQRLRYEVEVVRDLSFLRKTLSGLDPGIVAEASEDGSSVVLSGEVADRETSEQAERMAKSMLTAQGTAAAGGGAVQVVNLIRAPTSSSAPDLWLDEALRAIDSRIRPRRIQVGPEPNPERDSYILEGKVKNVQALRRAVILAERQLGNSGVRVSSPAGGLSFERNQNFSGAGAGGGAAGSLGGSSRLQGGLAGQIARGLAITSESGRVLSMLEVDDLPQIMVSIRVLEVDRAKAKKAGFNFRFDADHLSFGSFPGPQGRPPRQLGGIADVSGVAGNLVASFVDRTLSIVSAIDFLEDQELARSVSEPNILTLSGEEASVLVGGEIPIPITTLSQANSVQGFSFQDFGVRLDIRPTVDEEGVIALEVAPSIIRPSPALAVGGVPGFQVQSVQTTARVSAGQSLVLGGLLSFEEGFEESRLPVLGKSPLFRWRRKSRQQQELLFVITPRLVASGPTPAVPVEPARGEEINLPTLDWLGGEEGAPRCVVEPVPTLDANGLPPGFRREPPVPH